MSPRWTCLLLALTTLAVPARPRPGHLGCQTNLKNIGTALDLYANDNSSHYPVRLDRLVPTYLNAIPTCPSAHADTYSAGYAAIQNPDAYAFYCCGSYHKERGFAANHPGYTWDQGLIEHPSPAKLAVCQETLKSLADQLRKYRTRHKALPQKLADLGQTPTCGGREYVYRPEPNHKDFKLMCGGYMHHVDENVCAMQPSWDSRKGLQSPPCPVVAPGLPVAETQPNALALRALAGLSVLLGVISLGPRRPGSLLSRTESG